MTAHRQAHRLVIRVLCSRIFLFAALEALFVLVYIIWAMWRGYPLRFLLNREEIGCGMLLALPLLFINYLLFFGRRGPAATPGRFSRECAEFIGGIILPFVREITPAQAAVLSISAGLGEELLFRGVLQAEVGVAVSSLLFALLHFGPAVHKFLLIALLYFVTSLYLAAVSFLSLGTVVVTHVTYDFLALFYLILASNIQGRVDSLRSR